MLPCLLFLAVIFQGCSSAHHELVLNPVGPGPQPYVGTGKIGSLIVFSAREPGPEDETLRYRDRYSEYTVLSENGKEVVQRVRNDDGKLFGSPQKVELPTGDYRVIARANGYGPVTVPVRIEPNQTTVVHLEGSVWWPRRSAIFDSDPVRLPSGQIVGWRASAKLPPETR